jgi:hypothetical protein
VPLANFFLFGLHKVSEMSFYQLHLQSHHQDIIAAWCFWKPCSAEVDVMQSPVLKNNPEASQV